MLLSLVSASSSPVSVIRILPYNSRNFGTIGKFNWGGRVKSKQIVGEEKVRVLLTVRWRCSVILNKTISQMVYTQSLSHLESAQN